MKSIKIGDKMHKKFKVWCAEKELNMSDVNNKLIEMLMNGEIKYDIRYKK